MSPDQLAIVPELSWLNPSKDVHFPRSQTSLDVLLNREILYICACAHHHVMTDDGGIQRSMYKLETAYTIDWNM